MKRFHRRCRRLCILAALLVLLVLFLRQNVLLDTASRHAILLDAQSGRVLAQKRADERTAPASLTKMMTVLLAIETEPDLDKQVTLPEDIFPALQTEKASMAGFVPDETVTVRDLLYGAMLPSGAECCEALAQLVSGSEENFAALMNQKAAELGMKNTHFTNATGLTDTEHYSSAADMAKLLQAALHNTTFRTIFTTEHYTTTATAQHPEGVSLTSTLQIVARGYCRSSIGRVSHLPVLRLAPVKENRNNCPFLTENHCAIHEAEPLVCALYPLAQEISRAGEVHYFLQPTGCGGQVIEAKVQDYLARYDVPAREAIDVRWAQTCMALEDTVEQLEAVLSPVLVRRMQAKLWQALYFGYDYAQDYLPQLEANLQTLDMELHKLTEYQKKRNNSSK